MEIEVITGPTASGKTSLALERAKQNPAIEIINADASLLYRGFDIGTAKPSKEIRSGIPHHLIDILEPSERFSAADYMTKARTIIRDCIARSKTPIVVGGTGFYIDALFFGMSPLTVGSKCLDEARKVVARKMEKFGFDELLKDLERVDPILYEQISRERNPRRLERAWEYFYATGTALGEARKEKPEPFELEPVFTLIEIPREELRKRIEERIGSMLAAGWIDEVRGLLANGITKDMPAMNAIGYRELAAVIEGKKSLDEAREEIFIRTRQYAKRQETWMKRYSRFVARDS